MVPEHPIHPNRLYVSDEEWAEIRARLPPTESQIDEWCRQMRRLRWWEAPATWGGLLALTVLMCWGLYKLVRLGITTLISLL